MVSPESYSDTKHLILIGGATASGKTALAIALARELQCPIISADSRQFYREMSIGTAKPTAAERQAAKHYFVDTLSITHEYSVGQFERDAMDLLSHVYEKHQYCIAVGGSGLYLRALAEGLDDFPRVDKLIIQKYQEKLNTEGIKALQQELQKQDPDYAQIVDLNNPQRIIRALSIMASSGKTFSSFWKKAAGKRPFTCHYFKTSMDRAQLYERINTRVDKMIDNGLIEEAKNLLPYRHYNSLQTVGYKELFDYFDGHYTRDEAIAKIKQHTRNYAKRQITWFNNQGTWIPVESSADIVKHLQLDIP